MKRIIAAVIILGSTLLTGCSSSGPKFTHELNQQTKYMMGDFKSTVKGTPEVYVEYTPDDFPKRVQRVGSASNYGNREIIDLPLGEGISSRLEQALNEVAEVNEDGQVVKIHVLYIAAEYTTHPTRENADTGKILIRYITQIGQREWQRTMVTQRRGTSFVEALEFAMDDISTRMAKDIIRHL